MPLRILIHKTWKSKGYILFAMILIPMIVSCGVSIPGNQSLQQTQIALGIQQTQLAMQSAQDAASQQQSLQATIDALSFQATQAVLGQAAQPQEAEQPPQPIAPTLPPSQEGAVSQTQAPAEAQPTLPPPAAQVTPLEDIDALMRSAHILLFEDMIQYTSTIRFVKKTLDRMGLQYTDVGNAIGMLKEQLLYKAPPTGWDLIIIAAEAKTAVNGELFTYVYDALQNGSSVILEIWYLDSFASGTAEKLLEECGIEWQSDWENVPVNRRLMWPVNFDHPIMRVPNANLTFTDVNSFWPYYTDLGDLVMLVPGSSAKILVAQKSDTTTTHGTVTACVNDRLVIQTFSSHQLSYEDIEPLWENYIYNTLKMRLESPR